jgi:5'-3' exonuclease
VSSDRPGGIKAHLVDGTYELFRHYYGAPSHTTAAGEEVGATRAVLGSLLGMIEGGATHIGVATDHVIESWRNHAWPTYKSSAGVPADLLGQFALFEEAMVAAGFVVWPMVELEADDALASAASVLAGDPRVGQILICTPDKDLGQCVQGERVVCLDRRKGQVVDEAAVRERFGVGPASVPDWLALVGDSSDCYPGVPGWGPKAASTVLARYGHIEAIPKNTVTWDVPLTPARAASLATSLAEHYEDALLFKRLATCTREPSLLPPGEEALNSLAWRGSSEERFGAVVARLEAPSLAERYARLVGGGASKRT